MNRIIQIHIPRTAGRSVIASLHDYGDVAWRGRAMRGGHWTAAQLREELGSLYDEAELVFTVVRNPWDWRFSWYHWLRNCAPGGCGLPVAEALCKSVSFLDHLRMMLEMRHTSFFVPTRYGRTEAPLFIQPQVDYLAPEVRLLRFENLAVEFKDLFGIPLNAHIGRSHDLDYRAHYDDKGREIVRKLFAADIDAFGYSF